MSPDALLHLWRQYQETGDQRLRDRLILSLAPIVKSIVYRKVREVPSHREVDDFLSCGLEALIRSIDRYDPDRGATLEQFVWTRIHGAVLDELRRFDWAPRSLRRMERELNRARERFTVLHGRGPTSAELADLLAIDEAELSELLADVHRAELGSLNAPAMSDDDTQIERLDTVASRDREFDPEFAAMREGAIARLREAFDELPERERKVALLLHVGRREVSFGKPG
jgi:RNA polymerase sigma factor for flagellar operon FliA